MANTFSNTQNDATINFSGSGTFSGSFVNTQRNITVNFAGDSKGSFSHVTGRSSLNAKSGGIFSKSAAATTIAFSSSAVSTGVFSRTSRKARLNIGGYNVSSGSFSARQRSSGILIEGGESTSGTFTGTASHVTTLFRSLLSSGCVAVCLSNLANTEYNNFPFNSFANFNGTILAANGNGIYVLGGNNDAGANILATLETPQDDFGSSKLKRVPDIIVGIEAGAMQGYIVQDGVASAAETTASTSGKTKSVRFRPGRGAEHRYWGVRLQNVAGSDFKLDTIELFPEILKRELHE